MKKAIEKEAKTAQKFSLYMGAAASSWLLALMVIIAELAPPFKDLLKSIFTHHWIGKLVITAVAFVLAGFLLKDKKSIGAYTDDNAAYYSVIASLAAILLFFIIHYFVA